MRSFWCVSGLAVVLLATSVQSRADEPLADLGPIAAAPRGCDAGTCVAVPGDSAGGICRRPAIAAVATAGRAPVAVVRRVAARIQERPILRRLFSRCRAGGCRR